jgi:hypothetical protein
MNDAELRALIRDAVARRLGHTRPGAARPVLPPARTAAPTSGGGHPSQVIYLSLANAGEACLIEPGVTCNHCGYCKTHGY